MNIRVSENWEPFIRSQVQSGRYRSEHDVLDEALSLLRERDQGGSPTEEIPTIAEETAFDRLDRAGLIGRIRGAARTPTDLSTNPKHMEGFGRE